MHWLKKLLIGIGLIVLFTGCVNNIPIVNTKTPTLIPDTPLLEKEDSLITTYPNPFN